MQGGKRLVVLIVLLTVSVGIAAERPQDIPAARRAHLGKGGIRGAAEAAGSYKGQERVDLSGAPTSLASLVDLSDIIIVGTAATNLCFLSIDGRRVWTAYVVEVNQVIKGNPLPGRVSVLLPGGKVLLDSGATAQIDVLDFERPTNSQRYVWFLRLFVDHANVPGAAGVAEPRYETLAGPLGLYKLGPKAVRPNGGNGVPLTRYFIREKLSPVAFTDLIKLLVRG